MQQLFLGRGSKNAFVSLIFPFSAPDAFLRCFERNEFSVGLPAFASTIVSPP